MGKRGRPSTPVDVLEKRGSRLTSRKPDEVSPSKVGSADLPDEAEILACMKLLPGYDPWVNADGYHFDCERALKAIRFFHEELSHAKGEWARQPFRLERWQIGVVANLFGWVDDDGLRRYRECLVYIPRKNGKTAWCAGLLLYLLFEEGDPGAEIYGAGAEYEQASLVWHHARMMVLQNPKLDERASIFKGQQKAIQLGVDTGFSTYKVICSKAATSHGMNPHAAVIDELHVQPNRDLHDVLATGMGTRRQPLMIHLTTADFIRESICNEKVEYARRVCETGMDQTFLPVLYEADPEKDDWKDREVWKRVNPNYGVSVKPAFLEKEFKRAEASPAFESAFKRLYLNMQTEADVRWITSTAWDAGNMGNDPRKWREEAIDRNKKRPCVGALDLGSTQDLTALVLLFEREGDGRYDVIPWFWLPEDALNNGSRSAVAMYRAWVDHGWITKTPGNACDYDRIRADVNAHAKTFSIQQLAIDRLFQGAQLSMQLADDGLEVVAFGQGFVGMAAPSKRFEELVLSGRIVHGGNPVLRWMMANCAVEMDAAGNIKPSKKKSSEKIDGIVCCVMCVGIMVEGLKSKPKMMAYLL